MRRHSSNIHSLGCLIFFQWVLFISAHPRVDHVQPHNEKTVQPDTHKNDVPTVDRVVADMNAIAGSQLTNHADLHKGIWMTREAFDRTYANHWHCPRNPLIVHQSMILQKCRSDLECSSGQKCCHVKKYSKENHCIKYDQLLSEQYPIEILDTENRLLIAIQRNDKIFVHCPKSVQFWKLAGGSKLVYDFPLSDKSSAVQRDRDAYSDSQFIKKFGRRWECPTPELATVVLSSSPGNPCADDLNCNNIFQKCCHVDNGHLQKQCLDVRSLLHTKRTVTVSDVNSIPMLATVVRGVIIVGEPKSSSQSKGQYQIVSDIQVRTTDKLGKTAFVGKQYAEPDMEAESKYDVKVKPEVIGTNLKQHTDAVDVLIDQIEEAVIVDRENDVPSANFFAGGNSADLQSRSFLNHLKGKPNGKIEPVQKPDFALDSILPISAIIDSIPIPSSLPKDTVKGFLDGIYNTLKQRDQGNSSLIEPEELLSKAARFLPLLMGTDDQKEAIGNIEKGVAKLLEQAVANMKARQLNAVNETDERHPRRKRATKGEKILAKLPVGFFIRQISIFRVIPDKVIADILDAIMESLSISDEDLTDTFTQSNHLGGVVLSSMKLLPVLQKVAKYKNEFLTLIIQILEFMKTIIKSVGTGTPDKAVHPTITADGSANAAKLNKEVEAILSNQQDKDLKTQMSNLMEVVKIYNNDAFKKMETVQNMFEFIHALPVLNALPPQIVSAFVIGVYEQSRKMLMISDSQDKAVKDAFDEIARTLVRFIPLVKEIFHEHDKDLVDLTYHLIEFGLELCERFKPRLQHLRRPKRDAGVMGMMISMLPIADMIRSFPGLSMIPEELINKIVDRIVTFLNTVAGDSEHLSEIMSSAMALMPLGTEIVRHQLTFIDLAKKYLELGSMIWSKQMSKIGSIITLGGLLRSRSLFPPGGPKGTATTVLDDLIPLSQILTSLPILNALPYDTVVNFFNGLLKAFNIGDNSGGPLSKNGLLGEVAKTFNKLLPVIESILNNKAGFINLVWGTLEFIKEILWSFKPYIVRMIPPSLIRFRRDISHQELENDDETASVEWRLPLDKKTINTILNSTWYPVHSEELPHIGNLSALSILMGTKPSTIYEALLGEQYTAETDTTTKLKDPSVLVNSLVKSLPVFNHMSHDVISNLTNGIIKGVNNSYQSNNGVLRKTGPMGSLIQSFQHLAQTLHEMLSKKENFVSFVNQLYDATSHLLKLVSTLKLKMKAAFLGDTNPFQWSDLTFGSTISKMGTATMEDNKHLTSTIKGYVLLATSVIRSLPLFNMIPEKMMFQLINDVLNLVSFEEFIKNAGLFGENGLMEKIFTALDQIKPFVGDVMEIKVSILKLGSDFYEILKEALESLRSVKSIMSDRIKREISLRGKELNLPTSTGDLSFSIETILTSPEILELFEADDNNSTHRIQKRAAGDIPPQFMKLITTVIGDVPILSSLPPETLHGAFNAIFKVFNSGYRKKEGLLRGSGPMGGIVRAAFKMLPLMSNVVSHRLDFIDIVKHLIVLADELWEHMMNFLNQVKLWFLGISTTQALAPRSFNPFSSLVKAVHGSSIVDVILSPALDMLSKFPYKTIMNMIPISLIRKLATPGFAILGVRKEGDQLLSDTWDALMDLQPLLESIVEYKEEIIAVSKQSLGLLADMSENLLPALTQMLSGDRRKRDIANEDMLLHKDDILRKEIVDVNDRFLNAPYTSTPVSVIESSFPKSLKSTSNDIQNASFFKQILDGVFQFIFAAKDILMLMFSWISPSTITAPSYLYKIFPTEVLGNLWSSFEKFLESIKGFSDNEHFEMVNKPESSMTQVLSNLPILNLIPKQTVDTFFTGLFNALKLGQDTNGFLGQNGILANLMSTSKKLLPLLEKIKHYRDGILSIGYNFLEFIKEMMSSMASYFSNSPLPSSTDDDDDRRKRSAAGDSSSTSEEDSFQFPGTTFAGADLKSRSIKGGLEGIALLDSHIPFTELIQSLPILNKIPLDSIDTVIRGISSGLSSIYEQDNGIMRKSGPAGKISRSLYQLLPVLKDILENKHLLLELVGHAMDAIRHAIDYAVYLGSQLLFKLTSLNFVPLVLTSRRLGGTPVDTAVKLVEGMPKILSTLPILDTIPETTVVDFFTKLMKAFGVGETKVGLLRKDGPVIQILASVSKLLPIIGKMRDNKQHLMTMANHILEMIREVLLSIKQYMPKFISNYIRKRRSIESTLQENGIHLQSPLKGRFEKLENIGSISKEDEIDVVLSIPKIDSPSSEMPGGRKKFFKASFNKMPNHIPNITIANVLTRKRRDISEEQSNDAGFQETSMESILKPLKILLTSLISSLPILNDIPPATITFVIDTFISALNNVFQQETGFLRKSGPISYIVKGAIQLMPTITDLLSKREVFTTLASQSVDVVRFLIEAIVWFVDEVKNWLSSVPAKIADLKRTENKKLNNSTQLKDTETISGKPMLAPLTEILHWFPILNAIPYETVHDFVVAILDFWDFGGNSSRLLSKNGLLGPIIVKATNMMPLLQDIASHKQDLASLALYLIEFLKELLSKAISSILNLLSLKSSDPAPFEDIGMAGLASRSAHTKSHHNDNFDKDIGTLMQLWYYLLEPVRNDIFKSIRNLKLIPQDVLDECLFKILYLFVRNEAKQKPIDKDIIMDKIDTDVLPSFNLNPQQEAILMDASSKFFDSVRTLQPDHLQFKAENEELFTSHNDHDRKKLHVLFANVYMIARSVASTALESIQYFRSIPKWTVDQFLKKILYQCLTNVQKNGSLNKHDIIKKIKTRILPIYQAEGYNRDTLLLIAKKFFAVVNKMINAVQAPEFRARSLILVPKDKLDLTKKRGILESIADQILAKAINETKQMESKYHMTPALAEFITNDMDDKGNLHSLHADLHLRSKDQVHDDFDDEHIMDVEKPGKCPSLSKSVTGWIDNQKCEHDGDCFFSLKCCPYDDTPWLQYCTSPIDVAPEDDYDELVEAPPVDWNCPLTNFPLAYTSGSPSCYSDEDCKAGQKCCSYIQGITPKQYCATHRSSDLVGYVLGDSTYTLSERSKRTKPTTTFDPNHNPVIFNNETGDIISGNSTIDITLLEQALHDGVLLMINKTDSEEREKWEKLLNVPFIDIVQAMVDSDKGKLQSRRVTVFEDEARSKKRKIVSKTRGNVKVTKQNTHKKYVDRQGHTYIKISAEQYDPVERAEEDSDNGGKHTHTHTREYVHTHTSRHDNSQSNKRTSTAQNTNQLGGVHSSSIYSQAGNQATNQYGSSQLQGSSQTHSGVNIHSAHPQLGLQSTQYRDAHSAPHPGMQTVYTDMQTGVRPGMVPAVHPGIQAGVISGVPANYPGIAQSPYPGILSELHLGLVQPGLEGLSPYSMINAVPGKAGRSNIFGVMIPTPKTIIIERDWKCPLINSKVLPTSDKKRCGIDEQCEANEKCCPFVLALVESYSVCSEKSTGIFGSVIGGILSPFTSRSYSSSISDNYDDGNFTVKSINGSFYAGNKKLDMNSLEQIYRNFTTILENNSVHYNLTDDLVNTMKSLTMEKILQAQLPSNDSMSFEDDKDITEDSRKEKRQSAIHMDY